MTTPTEHWAQLSGAELVAELRAEARPFDPYIPDSPRSWRRASQLRAAEVIEAQAQEIYDLRRRLASAAQSEHRRLNDSLKRSYEP